MSESPEFTTTPASAPPASATQQKPYWLYRFAAWVVIVAGIVFIASTIFFAGAFVSDGGWHCHHRHHHHHHHAMVHGDHHHRGSEPASPEKGAPGPSELPPGR